MKPTQKQIELIKAVRSIVSSWASTNDLSSPTHYGDIREEMNKFIMEHSDCIVEQGLLSIERLLSDILKEIKDYDRKDKEA